MAKEKELVFRRNTFSGEQIAPGVYLSSGRIVKARNIAGMKTFEQQKEPYEMGVQLSIQVEGHDKPFTMTIDGKFKRGEDGKTIVDQGSAFRVFSVFFNLGYEGEFKASAKLPQDAIDFLIGKEIYRLSYTKGLRSDNSGKQSYGDFNVVHPATPEGRAKIIADWERQRSKGYPKNYIPPGGTPGASPADAESEVSGREEW